MILKELNVIKKSVTGRQILGRIRVIQRIRWCFLCWRSRESGGPIPPQAQSPCRRNLPSWRPPSGRSGHWGSRCRQIVSQFRKETWYYQTPLLVYGGNMKPFSCESTSRNTGHSHWVKAMTSCFKPTLFCISTLGHSSVVSLLSPESGLSNKVKAVK